MLKVKYQEIENLEIKKKLCFVGSNSFRLCLLVLSGRYMYMLRSLIFDIQAEDCGYL